MKRPLKIALVIEQTSNHTRGIARGISLYAQTHGPWLFSTIKHADNSQLIASPLNSFSHIESDGIIAYTRDEKLIQKLTQLGRPVVNTTQAATLPPILPSVFTDDRALGQLAADYFISRKFQNFAYCGSCLNSAPCSIQRGNGFTEYAQKKGFGVFTFPPLDTPSHDIDWYNNHTSIAHWIQSLPKPVALFTDNDSCGRIVADICRKLDIHVPEEVAIAGVNNDELICEFSNPHLSSVTLAKEQLGFEAASLIEQLIKKRKLPSLPVLVPPLGVTTRRSSDIFAVEDRYVARALNFIYNHAGEQISVKDILRKIHLSRRSLEIRFRQTINRTPYEEIRRAHVERAKKMLSETNLHMEQIAEASGFSETKHFYTNFRKETGFSPTQYRKQFKTINHPKPPSFTLIKDG